MVAEAEAEHNQFGAQRATEGVSNSSTPPSGIQSPIPPPPKVGKVLPKQNWKEANGYGSKPDSETSSVNGDRTPSSVANSKRIDFNGQNIPAAIANAFADPRKDKKPFSYFSGGFAPDLSDKPAPSAVKRSNQGSPVNSAYSVPRVLPIVSDKALRLEEERRIANQRKALEAARATPSGHNREINHCSINNSSSDEMPITHVQYNDPINLYSKDSLNEAVQQAVGVPGSGGAGSVPQSGTYRLIQEQERGGRSQNEQQSGDYPHYQGYTDPRVQSPSLKRLQQVTGVESDDVDGHPGHRVYAPENPDPTFRKGHNPHPSDAAQTRWAFDTKSQTNREVLGVRNGGGVGAGCCGPYEAKGAERPATHRCDDPKNPAYRIPTHNPGVNGLRPSKAMNRRFPKTAGHKSFGQKFESNGRSISQQQLKEEEPMNPKLAAKIAEAERPKLPRNPEEPHWAKAAAAKRHKWDSIMTEAEHKAVDRLQRSVVWSEEYQNNPAHNRFPKTGFGRGSDKDKWQKHYSNFGLEKGGRYFAQPPKQVLSPRRTTGHIATGERVTDKEPWLRPFVAPNVGVVKYRPPAVERSYSDGAVRGCAVSPLSFGLYYGAAHPHDHHYHAQPYEMHKHKYEYQNQHHKAFDQHYHHQQYHKRVTPQRAGSFEHEFRLAGSEQQHEQSIRNNKMQALSNTSRKNHYSQPMHNAEHHAHHENYYEHSSSPYTHQKINWPPSGEAQAQPPPSSNVYEAAAPYSKTTNYTKKTWDHTETQNGGAAVAPSGGGYSNPGYQYESDAEKQRRYMEEEMGRRVANAPPMSSNPGNPGNPNFGAPQGWKPPPTTTTSVSGGRPPWRPVSAGLPEGQPPSAYESSAPFSSSVSPYGTTGGAPYGSTAPYTGGVGSGGLGSVVPKWQGQPGTNTKAHATGSYVDPEGNKVSYTKEVYTTADPGKEFSMLTEEERKILEQPLQPGVVSRHVTTKYYKKSTFTSNTTTSTTDSPPVTSLPGISQLSITDRPGSVGPGVTQF